MKTFNRRLAGYIALSLLIVDAFAVNLHGLQSHLLVALLLVWFLVVQPGVLLVAGITWFIPSLMNSTVFLSFASCVLSAAFWAVVFGFIFRSKLPPNKSPEPTAVGAVRSAIAVHAASRRWLSFLR